MKYFQEVTDWGDNIPNHIYYMKDDKSRTVGYIRAGTKKLFKFKNPIAIDIRGRKFVELKNLKSESDSVYFGKAVEEKSVGAIEVKGSNGKVYLLTKGINDKYNCTCPGFIFRHKCKHSDEMNNK